MIGRMVGLPVLEEPGVLKGCGGLMEAGQRLFLRTPSRRAAAIPVSSERDVSNVERARETAHTGQNFEPFAMNRVG
jgi:hypothetical protein